MMAYLFLLISCLSLPASLNKKADLKPVHTIYVSVTSIYFLEGEILPTVKIRLFYDDLQRCSKAEWGLAENPVLSDFAEGGLNRFINDHLKIKMDSLSVDLDLSKIEEDGEALSIQMTALMSDSTKAEDYAAWKNIYVINDLFTAHIDAQQNLIRFKNGSTRSFENLDRKRIKARFTR